MKECTLNKINPFYEYTSVLEEDYPCTFYNPSELPIKIYCYKCPYYQEEKS